MGSNGRRETDVQNVVGALVLLGTGPFYRHFGDLQPALLKAWRLPALLIRPDGAQHSDSAQVKNVTLAARLARRTADDWNNAATLPDDVADIAAMLLLGNEPTLKLLREFDA